MVYGFSLKARNPKFDRDELINEDYGCLKSEVFMIKTPLHVFINVRPPKVYDTV